MIKAMEKINPVLQNKLDKLISVLKKDTAIAIALSGGVDSSLLLVAAKKYVKAKVIAVTAESVIHPDREIDDAKKTARLCKAEHYILGSREMDDNRFVQNTKDRCYICKTIVFGDIIRFALKKNISTIVHGANTDDLKDYRPGMKAADEMGIKAPFLEAGLGKSEIRELAKALKIPVWNKPAMACLATRIPYGMPITKAKIEMIDRAENVLHDFGFTACRVRHHDDLARIEVDPADFENLLAFGTREKIVSELQKIGYTYVSVDLAGYEQGKMNRSLGASDM